MSTRADASEELVTADLLRYWALPEPGDTKHERGHVLVVGGARSTPGAVLLAGLAALRVGAGVLAVGVEDVIAGHLAVGIPEASVAGIDFASPSDALAPRLSSVDVVLLGPGVDEPGSTGRLLQVLLDTDVDAQAMVLDAFALGVLAKTDEGIVRVKLPPRLVLTPNPDEAARLLSLDVDDPAMEDASEVATTLAAKYSAVIAYQRHIADAEGRHWFVDGGNPGLATSGSGDVLAGAITGLLARGATPAQAACWGVHLHAAAGDRLATRVGPLGYLARELLDELPRLLAELSHD